MLRSRRRGQSIVEFGIIAILFTLIMFAIADFGLLLNDWLSVSSAARLLARDAAVGMTWSNLKIEAQNQPVAGVVADPPFTSICCDIGNPGSALQLSVTYCVPDAANPANCTPIGAGQAGSLDDRYWSCVGTTCTRGQCGSWSQAPPVACPHPAAPSQSGVGDNVIVTFTAAGAQVVTPLVRPFFSNPTTCTATSPHCYVSLSNTVSMRFEGDVLS